MNFSQLEIGTRLGLGIALAATLLVINFSIGIAGMSSIKTQLDLANEDRLPNAAFIASVKENLLLQAVTVRNMGLLNGAGELKTEFEILQRAYVDVDKAFKPLETTQQNAAAAYPLKSQARSEASSQANGSCTHSLAKCSNPHDLVA